MKRYEIWQPNADTKEGRAIRFSSFEQIKKLELTPKKECYNKVYEGVAHTEFEDELLLEELYLKFQGKKPAGYTGYSVSVSDVIVLEGQAYYVDSFGFEKIDF